MSGPLFRDRATAARLRVDLVEAQRGATQNSEDTERRDIWRHKAGLDTNGHGVITHEPEEHL